MDYQVKNYRALRSGAFEGTLWHGKRKVAAFHNDGRGGMTDVRFDNRADRTPFIDWLRGALPASHWAREMGTEIYDEVGVDWLSDVKANDTAAKKGRLVRAKSGVYPDADPLAPFPYGLMWTVPSDELLPSLRAQLDSDWRPGLVLETWDTAVKDWTLLDA